MDHFRGPNRSTIASAREQKAWFLLAKSAPVDARERRGFVPIVWRAQSARQLKGCVARLN